MLYTAATVNELKEKLTSIQKQYADLRALIDTERYSKKIKAVEDSIEELRGLQREEFAKLKHIQDQIGNAEKRLAHEEYLLEVGIYERQFEFADSDQFKFAIKQNRELQKKMISSKLAVAGGSGWTVNDSVAKGNKLVNQQTALLLRAFNNECDAAIAKVRWNNIGTMEKRISRSMAACNKLTGSMALSISENYYRLKLDELFLTHEYREKQKEERDHKTDIARLKREEEKLIKDAKKAADQEIEFEKLVKQAEAKVALATGEELGRLEAEADRLREELSKAHARAERAKSMAEQTRAGFVYVISNHGSFGDEIVKIGMTRRLDPMDRVRELGDASVPFVFDVHALVYSEDAPGLERELHRFFEAARVNMVNQRKEFFRVSLSDVEARLREFKPDVDFVHGIEAQEYNETLAASRAM